MTDDRELVDEICRHILVTKDLREALELAYLLEAVVRESIENEQRRMIVQNCSSTFNELCS